MKFLVMTAVAMFLAVPSHAAIKDWTLLVFINGHNNLDRYGYEDINELEKIGSNDNINLVVQHGSLQRNTQRILVTKDEQPNTVTSLPVLDMGSQVDMGSYKNLVDFVKWGVENYPAKKYFVVFWNHGSGWQRAIKTRGISYDDLYNTHITTLQVGAAMKEVSNFLGRKIDVVGMDACLMAMPEIAGEISNYVETYVASEENEPAEGWPYDALAAKMVETPEITSNELAAHLTAEYVKSYQGGTQGYSTMATLSAFDLTVLSNLERAVSDLSKSVAVLAPEERLKVIAAAKSTQSFGGMPDYRDLGDFMSQLNSSGVRGVRSEIMIQVSSMLSKFVVSNSVSTAFPNAKGASFWLPTSAAQYQAYQAHYAALKFHQRTNWGSALDFLFE